MKIIRFMGVMFFFLSLGCAHTQPHRMHLALSSDPEICKHCNCYMPADANGQTPCPVCNCGYTAEKCYRGK